MEATRVVVSVGSGTGLPGLQRLLSHVLTMLSWIGDFSWSVSQFPQLENENHNKNEIR